jgi:hypothetical protein
MYLPHNTYYNILIIISNHYFNKTTRTIYRDNTEYKVTAESHYIKNNKKRKYYHFIVFYTLIIVQTNVILYIVFIDCTTRNQWLCQQLCESPEDGPVGRNM